MGCGLKTTAQRKKSPFGALEKCEARTARRWVSWVSWVSLIASPVFRTLPFSVRALFKTHITHITHILRPAMTHNLGVIPTGHIRAFSPWGDDINKPETEIVLMTA